MDKNKQPLLSIRSFAKTLISGADKSPKGSRSKRSIHKKAVAKKNGNKKPQLLLKSMSKSLIGLLDFLKDTYSEVLLLVGLMVNVLILMVHNITLASIYLIIVFLRIITKLKIDQKSIKIADNWLDLDPKRFEDYLLICYPVIPTIYYSDARLLLAFMLFWTACALVYKQAFISKKVFIFLKETIIRNPLVKKAK